MQLAKNIVEVTKVVTMFNEHLSGVVNALVLIKAMLWQKG